ncbi:MAG: hypothetical protein WCS37_23080, partial [Chloroflexota bacterium]
KQFATIRPGEKEPPPGQRRNRMAYFFTVLRDLLGLPKKNGPVGGISNPDLTATTGRRGKSTDGAASHNSGSYRQTGRKANYAN